MHLDVAGHFTAAAAKTTKTTAATATREDEVKACLKRKIVCYKIQLLLWFLFLSLFLLLLFLPSLMRQCNVPRRDKN